jgi:mediator of RNA polymerase II transcription subunit 14
MCLEQVRCAMLEDELNRRGSCMGWVIRKAPITNEELHAVTKTRGPMRVLWLQKNGWRSNWFVAIILSLAGDQWWLLET